jgi:hypothetical protein
MHQGFRNANNYSMTQRCRQIADSDSAMFLTQKTFFTASSISHTANINSDALSFLGGQI